jgi:hypothetical protein
MDANVCYLCNFKNDTMKFNYLKLWEALQSTFVYGDVLKAKLKEIGITYSQWNNLKAGTPVSLECILKCFDYLRSEDQSEDLPPSDIMFFNVYLEGDGPINVMR